MVWPGGSPRVNCLNGFKIIGIINLKNRKGYNDVCYPPPDISTKRNGAIEFYRFIFALVVCLLHFRNYGDFGDSSTAFYGGYLAVDFFFIVSGYFLMQQWEKERRQNIGISAGFSTWCFVKSRFLRFLPEYLFAFITLAILLIFLQHMSLKQIVINGFWEILMLRLSGLGSGINGIFWFVSALLLGSAVVWFLLCKFKDDYIYFGVPVIFLLINAYFYQKYGHVDLTASQSIFIVNDGLLRAIAEIGLGCICYKAAIYLKQKMNGRFRGLQTILEIILFGLIVAIMWRTRRDTKDFIMIVMMAAFIILIMQNNSYLSKLLNNKISVFLGSISYGLYLNQRFFIVLISTLWPARTYWLMASIFLLVNIVFSIFTFNLCSFIIKRINQMKRC